MRFIILIILLPTLLFSSDFSKFSSVNFDLVGVVASDNKIAAYGTNGSVYYSDNDSKSWEVIKPFATGNIVNFFIESDRLVAFLQTGEVSQSFDNGLNWTVSHPINDSVAYVVKGNNSYFVRCKNSISKLDANLSLIDSYAYSYYRGFDITYHYRPNNRMTIAYLNNRLFVIDLYLPTMYTGLIVLDDNLNLLDSVNISRKLLGDDLIRIHSIMNTSGDIVLYLTNYTNDSTYVCKLDPKASELEVLLNLSDGKDKRKQMFKVDSSSVSNFRLYKDKLYTLNAVFANNHLGNKTRLGYNVFEIFSKDSAVYIDSIDANNMLSSTKRLSLEDFVIEGNRVTGIAKDNFIASKKLGTGKTQRISNLAGSNYHSNLFQINGSDFILVTDYNFYRSSDTTKTFVDVEGDTSVFQSYYKFKRCFNYFGEDAKTILYFVYSQAPEHLNDLPLVLISEDYGKTFSHKALDGVNLKNLANSYTISKLNNNYFISEINFGNNKIKYFIYDDNFNLLDSILDNQYLFFNLFGKDLNEFTFLGLSSDFADNNLYIKSTSDGGNNWNSIRKFSFVIDTVWYADSTKYFTTSLNELQYNKKLRAGGKDYWMFITYNPKDSLYKIEAMDLETNEFYSVFQSKQVANSNTIIELVDDVYYVCKGDTLFTTTDLLDYDSWVGHKLPNNGTMTTKIMRAGNYLITYYSDDIHPLDIYRIKWDKIISTDISSNDIENYKYIYSSPPYPQPTNNLVKVDVYLEKDIVLTNKSIEIYDINGTQVEKGENIILSGDNWPTKIAWDASRQPSGVYFIVINYGETPKSIKVIKE